MADGYQADSADGDTVSIVTDKVYLASKSVSDQRANVGEPVDINWTLRCMYDDLSIAPDNGNVNGDWVTLTWSDNNQRWEAACLHVSE